MLASKYQEIAVGLMVLFLVLLVVSCQSTKSSSHHEQLGETDLIERHESMSKEMSEQMPIGVDCQVVGDNTEELSVQLRVQNNSDKIIHLPKTWRMPYVLMQEDESLLILSGVEPPKPRMLIIGIEIPRTLALDPNEVFEAEVPLVPLYIGGHYMLSRFRNTPKEWHGLTTVHCQVGWGETPILPRKERNAWDINQFMEWQQITTAEPIQVTFP